MAARKIKRREPELTLQSEIVEFIKTILNDDVMITAFPSGGGGRIRGGKLKRAGLVAGHEGSALIRQPAQVASLSMVSANCLPAAAAPTNVTDA